MIRFLILAIFTISSGNIFPKDYAILSEWKTDKTSDGISISYRWVTVGDTLKTREMKTALHIHASPEAILKQFKSDEKLSKWTAGSRNCSVLQSSEDEWITYTLYDMPWPFTSNDLVTLYRKTIHNKITRIFIESTPDYIPEKADTERMEHYRGHWDLIPEPDGSTRVEFCTTSFTKPVFPRFIQDPILQEIMIDSMIKLKKQAEGEL
ncbi:hypothetical protein ACE1ET_02835 [Saccharicrinis sp. FJH62]|uniref:hypothetical protein n=1 Tax=Saccharicrinis sp. FJH62 TaxID=3344657 RepID=UPI0035D4E7AE